ncbi:transcriptional regulator [Aureimonas sp. Leaf454]|uniref:MarR family winged helix-turn-helix transcriptional regulator n=1 Tax=Aureimonas sp. Leaf454 TaxID=1736381 RepID=UPI0006F80B4D|nr:MarR family transcriptional regulator [Aureimonas sp. Leaf454]KQT44604.1 transcriptional regulator [Aureimonas sp. Leaf454]
MQGPERQPLDAESKVDEHPQLHRDELRLWLRLLTCTHMIEAEIRRRLRDGFDMTLPRFDLMAQLERAKDGILLGELSRRMMVTNGNITGLVERLVQEGLVNRTVDPEDRRAARVSLTVEGRDAFARMAKAHGDWLAEMMEGFDGQRQGALWAELGELKAAVRTALDTEAAPKPD